MGKKADILARPDYEKLQNWIQWLFARLMYAMLKGSQ